ncbi:MAG TPA: fatty acid desaturase [Polyangia bacterium]|jgi:stearoyl-CoA desaturase (delta-9 desaturase)|nr:fatty acid desaturase [Polyangia bacterium]
MSATVRLPPLDAAEISKLRPWKQPWWRPTVGDGPVLFWMILIHVTAVVGVILTPVPGWPVFAVAFALHFLGGLGTTVCFHRAITHRSVKLHPAVQNVLTFFAMLNGSGSPLSWAAYHRLHHAKSDTPEDISSPRVGGFWWSHLRWLWQAGAPPIKRYCGDMDTPGYRRWGRAQIPMAALAFAIGLPFGLAAFFWIGPIRLCWALHAQCFVNSICHMRQTQNSEEGTAKNVYWLSLMHVFQGENWHQNHHDRPGSARLGFSPGQLDVGWYTILLLEKLGLAKDVRRPNLSRELDIAA